MRGKALSYALFRAGSPEEQCGAVPVPEMPFEPEMDGEMI